MGKKFKAKVNPLLDGMQGLDFGDAQEEIFSLTPDQEAEHFLPRWMEVVDPFVEYPKTFIDGDLSADRLLLEVKRYYKRFVLEDGWSEHKYVFVINDIFENRARFYDETIKKHGVMYDNEDLLSQRRLRRKRRGK